MSDKLVKKVRFQYRMSIAVVVVSVLVMVFAPLFVEDFLWPAMLIPFCLHLPLAINGFRALRRNKSLNETSDQASNISLKREVR